MNGGFVSFSPNFHNRDLPLDALGKEKKSLPTAPHYMAASIWNKVSVSLHKFDLAINYCN